MGECRPVAQPAVATTLANRRSGRRALAVESRGSRRSPSSAPRRAPGGRPGSGASQPRRRPPCQEVQRARPGLSRAASTRGGQVFRGGSSAARAARAERSCWKSESAHRSSAREVRSASRALTDPELRRDRPANSSSFVGSPCACSRHVSTGRIPYGFRRALEEPRAAARGAALRDESRRRHCDLGGRVGLLTGVEPDAILDAAVAICLAPIRRRGLASASACHSPRRPPHRFPRRGRAAARS